MSVAGPTGSTDLGRVLDHTLADASPEMAVALLRHLFAAKEYDQALALIDQWWEAYSANPAFLKIARSVQGKRGELSAGLRTTHRLIALKAAPADAAVLLEGRLRELTGRVPVLPGPTETVVPFTPQRVLHLVKESRPYLSNGFTSRSHYNFLAERAAGLDPVIVTEPGFPRSVVGDAARPQVNPDGLRHFHLDLGPVEFKAMPVDRYLQLFADMALERVRHLRPALIHASSGRRGYETALVALAIKDRTGIPVVYEVRSFFEANWTDEVRYEARGELFEARMRLEEECMHRADFVLTIGESMRQEIISRGIPAEKVGIIPNGVDLERFTPRERPQALADELGIGDAPTFGYVSNMDHYREAQETLIAACASLKAAGREEHCLLVGGGPRRAMLEDLAESLGVADRVHFTGNVDHDQVVDYYALIDVFVVPRTRERAATHVTPLKPFEAMALGIPVLVSDLPALVELTDPPHRGWKFEPDDAGDLARVITEVVDDPAERARRVSAATEWIHTERQWVHNGPRYQQYFDHVLGRGELPR